MFKSMSQSTNRSLAYNGWVIKDDEGWESAPSGYSSPAVSVLEIYSLMGRPIIPNLFRAFEFQKYSHSIVMYALLFLRQNHHWNEDKYIKCYMNQVQLRYCGVEI